ALTLPVTGRGAMRRPERYGLTWCFFMRAKPTMPPPLSFGADGGAAPFGARPFDRLPGRVGEDGRGRRPRLVRHLGGRDRRARRRVGLRQERLWNGPSRPRPRAGPCPLGPGRLRGARHPL